MRIARKLKKKYPSTESTEMEAVKSKQEIDRAKTFPSNCIRKIAELIPDTHIVEPTLFSTGMFDTAGDGVIICPSPIGQHLSRIVIQADPGENYNFDKAKEHLARARKNRVANFGLYISNLNDPLPGLGKVFVRSANDIFVNWFPENPEADQMLHAAVSLGLALNTQSLISTREVALDLHEFNLTISSFESEMQNFVELADQIKIIDRTTSDMKKTLDKIATNVRAETLKMHEYLRIFYKISGKFKSELSSKV